MGSMKRKHESANIPLKIGSELDLWNKIMKEVKESRYVGPYTQPPFQSYVQSPLGLVPKAGNKMRLIFHLSFDFGEAEKDKSINYHTPAKDCKVKYNDLDVAIRQCLAILKDCKNGQLVYR